MRRTITLVALTTMPVFAFAQDDEGVVQRSSSPRGMQMRSDLRPVATVIQPVPQAASQDAGTARSVGSAKSNVNIQGNTAINANAQNVNAVTAGRKNAAGNEVGSIGGK